MLDFLGDMVGELVGGLVFDVIGGMFSGVWGTRSTEPEMLSVVPRLATGAGVLLAKGGR